MNWQQTLLTSTATLQDAIQSLEASSQQIVLIVSSERELLGIITDGDIRRAFMKGGNLNMPVTEVMFNTPTVADVTSDVEHRSALLKRKGIRHLPILSNGKVVGLDNANDITPASKENFIVLMAGGLGTRLRPITDNIPKPLIEVGTCPALETILKSFLKHGFKNFVFSVNYKAEMIEQYFGNGSRFGANIEYLYEKKRMGTAGALSLWQAKNDLPIFVMNGDLLTTTNLSKMLSFHNDHNSLATMGVREYKVEVPFGVVQFDKDNQIIDIVEKPTHTHFVNAGIYILTNEALKLIPKDEFYDMPSLFNEISSRKLNASTFPIHEYWMDIGNMSDLEKANQDFDLHFGDL